MDFALTSKSRNLTVEEIRKEAAKFWEEIKDLRKTDVAKGKTSNEVMEDILEHERVHNGIDWRKAVEGGADEVKKAMAKAHERLTVIRNSMNQSQIKKAKNMGLLDANGDVPVRDSPTLEAALFSETAPIPKDATTFPVWGWKPDHAAKFQNAKGNTIKNEVANLIRNFQVAEKSDTPWLVHTFMEIGILGLSVEGAKAAWAIISTLRMLTEETEAYAVLEGVLTIGEAVIKLAVATVVLAIIIPLMVLMNKDATALMVILNDTKEDLALGDLHTTHGKVVAIFQESGDVDNPKPIIPKKLDPIIDPKTGEVILEGSIQAGFFVATKRRSALIGTRGSLKLASTVSYPSGVFIGWEVPLSIGKNKVLVSADFTGSTSDFNDRTGHDGKQESSVVSKANARATGRINSGSGSKAYYIINVTDKA